MHLQSFIFVQIKVIPRQRVFDQKVMTFFRGCLAPYKDWLNLSYKSRAKTGNFFRAFI